MLMSECFFQVLTISHEALVHFYQTMRSGLLLGLRRNKSLERQLMVGNFTINLHQLQRNVTCELLHFM
jgi:hypothetical protein